MKNLNIQQINEIYKDLAYIIMTEKEFIEIVKNITEKEKESSRIIEKIRQHVLKKIDDNSNILEILDEIINTKFKNIIEYNEALNAIKYICDLLNKYDIKLNVETITNLLTSNEIFNAIVSIIINKNIQTIKKGNLYKLFKRKELNEIIEMYCIINNIEEDRIQTEYVPSTLTQYINEIKKIPLLTKEEEISLIEKAQKGDEEARNKIIEANLRLVVYIAFKCKKYYSKLDLEDLIQEGNFGLKEAIERVDLEKGYRFSTYAIWWIKKNMKKSNYDKGRTIRLTTYMVEKINKLYMIINELTAKLNREPTEEEIAQEMNISSNKVRELIITAKETTSLDIPIDENGDNHLADLIIDKDNNIENEVSNNIKIKKLWEYINELPKIYREIIILRYGLNGESPKTFQEIATLYSVSRQNIEQIEKNARKKLMLMIKSNGQEELLNDNYTYKNEEKIRRKVKKKKSNRMIRMDF